MKSSRIALFAVATLLASGCYSTTPDGNFGADSGTNTNNGGGNNGSGNSSQDDAGGGGNTGGGTDAGGGNTGGGTDAGGGNTGGGTDAGGGNTGGGTDAGGGNTGGGTDAGSTGTPDAGHVHDAGGTTTPDAGSTTPDSGGTTNTATWAYIYPTYFEASSSAGHCNNCHSGQLSATKSSFVSGNFSRLQPEGGDMPQDTTWSDPTAASTLNAWQAAGFP